MKKRIWMMLAFVIALSACSSDAMDESQPHMPYILDEEIEDKITYFGEDARFWGELHLLRDNGEYTFTFHDNSWQQLAFNIANPQRIKELLEISETDDFNNHGL